MANNPVGWFEIYVQDMARAKAFYQTVFQVKLDRLNTDQLEMMAFPGDMTSYGTPGALVRMEGCPSGGNSTLVYFSCADCAVEAGRVVPAGGKLCREKISVGEYGFVALALDTEGNMFGFHSLR
jgi:hypothetical protein